MTPADSLHALVHVGTRAVDVLGNVPMTTLNPEETAKFFEGWHEFYLLAGTAAVTLVGLLFVALSMHLDVLIHESKAHILAHARSTLLNFSYILVVSLGVLIPNQSTIQLGMLLAMTSLIVGTVALRAMLKQRRFAAAGFERSMRRRNRIQLVGYAIALLTGVAMVATRTPQLVFNMIGVICMMLGNAMGVSWDLIVEVGKLKAELANVVVAGPESKPKHPA